MLIPSAFCHCRPLCYPTIVVGVGVGMGRRGKHFPKDELSTLSFPPLFSYFLFACSVMSNFIYRDDWIRDA